MKDYLDEIVEQEVGRDASFALEWSTQTFGHTLARVRVASGISQAEAAEMIGTTQARIAEIERDPSSVRFSRVMEYAHALRCTLQVNEPRRADSARARKRGAGRPPSTKYAENQTPKGKKSA